MAEKEGSGMQAGKTVENGTPVQTEKTGAEEAKADAGVRHEKSCGAVVICTEGGARRYVLTRSLKGVWGFPKGHMEGQETEHRTALREIREETGLNVSFIKGFRRTDEYMILRKDAPAIDKQVVYFLARYERQTPVPQETEVSRIELFDYDGAMKRLTFDSSRRILAAAQRFLDRREGRSREK